MKKRISDLFTALLLSIALCAPAFAANGAMEFVIDTDDLLTYEEWETLEGRAAEISQRHGCGVYVVTVDDYTTYGSGDVYDVTTQLYHDPESSFGVGEGRDGILLLLSMATRDYATFVYGESAEAVFTGERIDTLEGCFLPPFGEDDWYGGFDAYLTACDEALTEGPPAPVEESPIGGVLTATGVSCAVAMVVCLVLKGKMKSVRRKAEAKSYVTFGGLELTERYDRFTHTTESRRRIERKSNKESGGGGSGSSGKF